nr:uncharacterized protein LOC111413525 [Onthophagus taurus]
MTPKLLLFFVLLCAIEISLAATAIEHAPAGRKLVAKGFSCFKVELGPMRDGQVFDNYSQEICGKVTCNTGYLTYETCSPYVVEGQPMNLEDPTKPFPECCNYPF